jgi:hypothetical protein
MTLRNWFCLFILVWGTGLCWMAVRQVVRRRGRPNARSRGVVYFLLATAALLWIVRGFEAGPWDWLGLSGAVLGGAAAFLILALFETGAGDLQIGVFRRSWKRCLTGFILSAGGIVLLSMAMWGMHFLTGPVLVITGVIFWAVGVLFAVGKIGPAGRRG